MEFLQQILLPTLLVIHLLVVIALIGIILLQPSEGGGLGMSGGGMSGFMSARSKANLFTRTTAILATIFFVVSLSIGIVTSQTLKKSKADINQAFEASTIVPQLETSPVDDFTPSVGE